VFGPMRPDGLPAPRDVNRARPAPVEAPDAREATWLRQGRQEHDGIEGGAGLD
jgi:hypothetical protein